MKLILLTKNIVHVFCLMKTGTFASSSLVCLCLHRCDCLLSGPTPLHLAARCGSLDSVACLVSNYANVLATDQDGWAPIHNAAYYDHEQVIKLLIRKNEAMLELQTQDE